MIACQAPHLPHAVVVAPPRRWDPPAPLASALLRETDKAPWLRPVQAGAMAASRHAPGQASMKQPGNAGPHRFTRVMASSLRAARRGVQLVQSMRLRPSKQLYWAVAGSESAAWGDLKAPHRPTRSLLRRINAYVARQVSGVSIIRNGHTTLGGQQGQIPVTIRNQLDYPVWVRIWLHVNHVRGGGFSMVPARGVSAAGTGTVVTEVIQVLAGQMVTKTIRVKATTLISTTIDMRLLTPSGRVLPGSETTMSVQPIHFGTFALVILVGALGVFMIASAGRAIRHGPAPATATEARSELGETDRAPTSSPGRR
jgi:hypothetical protein